MKISGSVVHLTMLYASPYHFVFHLLFLRRDDIFPLTLFLCFLCSKKPSWNLSLFHGNHRHPLQLHENWKGVKREAGGGGGGGVGGEGGEGGGGEGGGGGGGGEERDQRPDVHARAFEEPDWPLYKWGHDGTNRLKSMSTTTPACTRTARGKTQKGEWRPRWDWPWPPCTRISEVKSIEWPGAGSCST